MTTSIQEEIDLDIDILEFEETDDPDKKAHLINPPKNIHIWRLGMSARDVVDIARLKGLELEALCGFRFVPRHNPDKLDVCQTCMDLAGIIISEDG